MRRSPVSCVPLSSTGSRPMAARMRRWTTPSRVPPTLAGTFTGWVRDVLEFADDPERRAHGIEGLLTFFTEEVVQRRTQPGDDLLSELLHTEFDGAPVEESVVLGMAALVLIAGVDTTWSAIGSSLWHLATHSDDRARLVAEPSLMPVAIEELLRAYSPVTMARVVTGDVAVSYTHLTLPT